MNQLQARILLPVIRKGGGRHRTARTAVRLTLAVLVMFAGAASSWPSFAEDKPHLTIDDPSAFTLHDITPDEYIMSSILITSKAVNARPKTKSGRVILFRVQDPSGIIEVPWIEGLTAVESLRVWMGAER